MAKTSKKPAAAKKREGHIIECDNLVKIYKTPDLEVLALQGLDLTVDYGEMMAIIGNSGSGKNAENRCCNQDFSKKTHNNSRV